MKPIFIILFLQAIAGKSHWCTICINNIESMFHGSDWRNKVTSSQDNCLTFHILLLCEWNWKELVWVGYNVSKRNPSSPGHHIIFLWIIQFSLVFQSTATPGRSYHLLWALFSPQTLPFRDQRTQTRTMISPASQNLLIAKGIFSGTTHLALIQDRRS